LIGPRQHASSNPDLCFYFFCSLSSFPLVFFLPLIPFNVYVLPFFPSIRARLFENKSLPFLRTGHCSLSDALFVSPLLPALLGPPVRIFPSLTRALPSSSTLPVRSSSLHARCHFLSPTRPKDVAVLFLHVVGGAVLPPFAIPLAPLLFSFDDWLLRYFFPFLASFRLLFPTRINFFFPPSSSSLQQPEAILLPNLTFLGVRYLCGFFLLRTLFPRRTAFSLQTEVTPGFAPPHFRPGCP